MHAQTNIQLYKQLVRDDCSPDDMTLIRRAYELAVVLFTGLYRPNGKTFLDHVVGTASIMHETLGKPELTAAGLLHSAYSHGDFGFIGRISARSRSKKVMDSVGCEVETYVRMYHELPWNMYDAHKLLDQTDGMKQIEREVVLLRIANELEDHLDCGTLYCYSAAKHKDKLEKGRKLLSDLSCRLGFMDLQHEIDQVFSECANHPVVPELLQRARRPRSYSILPESCRRSTWLSAYIIMSRAIR